MLNQELFSTEFQKYKKFLTNSENQIKETAKIIWIDIKSFGKCHFYIYGETAWKKFKVEIWQFVSVYFFGEIFKYLGRKMAAAESPNFVLQYFDFIHRLLPKNQNGLVPCIQKCPLILISYTYCIHIYIWRITGHF